MSLAGIGTGIASSQYLAGSAQLQQQTSAIRHSTAVSAPSNDTVSISGQGQFIGRLQALQASNPAKFQQVVTQAAADLQAAAKKVGNTPQGQALNDLAKKFQAVAAGGDISQLRPPTYTNRVQQAYGSHQASGVQDLLNSLGNGATSGTDPHYMLKSALSTLGKV
jgi:hypothetical protein